MFNPKEIKKDFPILARKINGKDLVYLDNAATSQKPLQVINAISDYYKNHNSNVHRGIHTLSEEASDLYEKTRKNVSEFVGAVRPKELVFTSGATQSLNAIAFGWGLKNLNKDDVILVSDVEHHSNLVPWQVVAERTGAKLELFSLLDLEKGVQTSSLEEKISSRVRIVSVPHSSNVTGAIIPIREIVREAKKVGALVCVDGAQAAPHLKIDVKSLGCDFYVFSAHKMLGPTGVGALWAKKEILEEMDPTVFGGGMIKEVFEEKSTWADVPEKFEAGTPNIAGVVGFSAAIDYLNEIGMDEIRKHEVDCNAYAIKKLQSIENLEIIGSLEPEERTGLVSFVIKGIHAHDVAAVLNTEGVAVRSGHHCAMPLHAKLDIPASTRASYYIYNTREDIDKLVAGVSKSIEILK